jgi:hydroxymethylpyrimidine pyrophosphatase-like HAD family hydrolase
MTSQAITVFGDNTNDIKMMKFADRAIAVANAKPEVKAIAARIADYH